MVLNFYIYIYNLPTVAMSNFTTYTGFNEEEYAGNWEMLQLQYAGSRLELVKSIYRLHLPDLSSQQCLFSVGPSLLLSLSLVLSFSLCQLHFKKIVAEFIGDRAPSFSKTHTFFNRKLNQILHKRGGKISIATTNQCTQLLH